MPLPNFSDSIEKNIIRHIKYRGTIRTGEITVDNGNETYDVKIAMSDQAYPNVETLYPNDIFQVGEIVTLGFEYGSKEIPKIIGHGKKVAQDPVEVEVDYSGIAKVETLNAYTITNTNAYLEGRITLGGAGNCKTRGFNYGTTTAYGSEKDEDGSYGDGSYALQVTSLTMYTTYHFRAYIIDENDDIIYGEDKTFKTTGTIDIGGLAIDRNNASGQGQTIVSQINPANETGTITSIEVWASNNISSLEVATFFVVSGNNLSTRDTCTIGSVTAGSKQTFTKDSGAQPISLVVNAGDYLGFYLTGGDIDKVSNTGANRWYLNGNYIPCTNTTFILYSTQTSTFSLYGTGI